MKIHEVFKIFAKSRGKSASLDNAIFCAFSIVIIVFTSFVLDGSFAHIQSLMRGGHFYTNSKWPFFGKELLLLFRLSLTSNRLFQMIYGDGFAVLKIMSQIWLFLLISLMSSGTQSLCIISYIMLWVWRRQWR